MTAGLRRLLFFAAAALPAFAQEGNGPDHARTAAGRAIYEQNCSPCHGARMADPQGAFDLRTFPPDQHERFVHSVKAGKNNMPPWGDLFTDEQIESLWSYVVAGERR
jgi:mono/diheme cytochrome c family protein